ncbi:PIGO [Cordylochernes scorpioides]|uniref:PIGO n=1 Tax=Cordylochernes scorpioides TaxID=51811 RepID=A0ABY6KXE2_9ARAC|nr:PIGO [Cordylochernes scorpioides]
MKKLYQISIFLWLLILYGIGLYFFYTGFFLKRIEIHNNSTCNDVKPIYNFIFKEFNTCNISSPTEVQKEICKFYRTLTKLYEEDNVCWYPPKYKKIVILLIDALKYDFGKYNDTIGSCKEVGCQYYHNKLPIFRELEKKGLILKLIADPPTTTLQRLKGLTTGSLPTFIDISSNFAGTEIMEDNLINQVTRQGKKVIFMGDDTWKDLFPNKFHRQYFYPSFNVKDLDTVDAGIASHLGTELESRDWELLVAHFLGVDHCGHTFGPAHPAMARKLGQLDQLIRSVFYTGFWCDVCGRDEVVPRLQPDTLLAVLSDHGMTSTGDHGGESPDETSAFFLAYSPSISSSLPSPRLEVPQVDVVPTLTVLLGVPIPFSSLGLPLPELVDHPDFSASPLQRGLYRALVTSTALHQMAAYLHEAGQSNHISGTDPFADVLDQWRHLLSRPSDMAWTLSQVDQLHAWLHLQGHNFREACRLKWAEFDQAAVWYGIATFASALSLNFLLLGDLRPLEHCLSRSRLRVYLWSIFVLPVVTLAVSFWLYVPSLLLLVLVPQVVLVWRFLRQLVVHARLSSLFTGRLNQLAVLILVVEFGLHFSNSLVLYEDRVTLYLTSTLLAAISLGGLQQSGRWRQLGVAGLCLAAVRCGPLFYKCREMQLDCVNSPLLTPAAHLPASWEALRYGRLALPVATVGSMVLGMMVWARRDFDPDSPSLLCLFYGLPFTALLLSAHWVVRLAPPQVLQALLPQHQVLDMSWPGCFLSPLNQSIKSIDIHSEVECISAFGPEFRCSFLREVSTKVYWNVRELSCSDEKEQQEELWQYLPRGVLLLCGLLTATVSGLPPASSLATLVLLAALALCLTLEDGLVPGLGVCLLWPLSVALTSTPGPRKVPEVPLYTVVAAFLLSWHGFFSTGHQTVLSAIHWGAATLASNPDSSYLLPAILVLLETFGTFFLAGLALPMASLVRYPIPSPLQSHLRLLFCLALKVLGSMLAGWHLRRHLMTWGTFAPNLMFVALASAAAVLGQLISLLMTAFRLSAGTSSHKEGQEQQDKASYQILCVPPVRTGRPRLCAINVQN